MEFAFATGALGSLLPKLAQLLHGEYQLQKNVRKNIDFVMKELETIQAALRIVGKVPTEQLNELVKIWAREARELSYDMEDTVDNFLVRVQGPPPSEISLIQKMESMLTLGKRHKIGEQIKDIKERVVELAARRDRCKVDTVNNATSVDTRIKALYVKTTELVGIEEARKEIILKLTKGDDMSSLVQKIVSIVGIGGLGKTTLAKAVYKKLNSQFHCKVFVTVSQNPDMKTFLKEVLYKLDNRKYRNIHTTSLDHLIDLVRGFFSHKRYLVVIDDIWDISDWDIIKCALPDDNTGCRIITTTRNLTVAEHIGGVYMMKPLSLDSSRQLLYTRLFGNEDLEQYLSKELAEVSDSILKKCAGVPLAIITIASLLDSKGRNKTEWDDVCNSIGNGLEKNSLHTKNMRKILSYSYYDLPSHLRTCLLYLSMFPEDFEIKKDHLIWLWIAEGFIKKHNDDGKSLFELGEGHFNELINRSMIQPIYDSLYNIEIDGCHVHDMVLDLIRSLSREENFVTLSSVMTTETKIRRLSIQHGKVDHGSTWCTKRMETIRSIIVFPSLDDHMPALQSFKVLRVLDLQNCGHSKGYNLKYLRHLLHLRYLKLGDAEKILFPEVIGNLQFLEILDLQSDFVVFYKCSDVDSCLDNSSGADALSLDVTQLKHLMCLKVDSDTVLNGIGSLRSLEELSRLSIYEDRMDNVEALSLLTELRLLHVALHTSKWNDKLMESLHNLQKIQDLCIKVNHGLGRLNIDGSDNWVVPPHLRSLNIKEWCWLSKLPAWKNNNPPHQLSILRIAVRELRQEDILILGRLPSLRHLELHVNHMNLGIYRRLLIGAGSFSCLLHCELFGFAAPVMFQQGAMPRLTRLYLEVHVGEARNLGHDGFHLGLGNLSSLQNFYFDLNFEYKSKFVKTAMAAVIKEAQNHPNHPYHKMYNNRAKGLY